MKHAYFWTLESDGETKWEVWLSQELFGWLLDQGQTLRLGTMDHRKVAVERHARAHIVGFEDCCFSLLLFSSANGGVMTSGIGQWVSAELVNFICEQLDRVEGTFIKQGE